MIFLPYQKLLSYLPIFKVYDPILNKSQILEMKNFVKYLGILMDFDLSWKNHIDLICQKISKTLGILARLRHTIPLSPLLKIYQALIRLEIMLSPSLLIPMSSLFLSFTFIGHVISCGM